ncbi:type IV pilus biogenesis/stability protein PilW [Luteimonas aquatica]|uniref:type IV pilus biogenesis/stability protein PilW n=1 Tax=Luteimonas aquatica TaxID=450364 RepID=UPI001F57ABC2|nr:type IV pilus biogenesis/stability protein PilW [Luteimonas aquatica]
MRLREAIAIAVLLSLAATACSRLTFVRPNPKIGKTESNGPSYDFKDSPEIKRETTLRDRIGLAQARLGSGEYDEAERLAQEALRLDPKSADVYTLLAVISDQRGNGAQAGGYYAKAAELAPDQGVALNNYGAWLCANGRAAEAMAWFDRAVVDPAYRDRASAMANAGACSLRAGQAGRAEQILRAALELAPENAVALEAMADVQYRNARYMEARAFSERRLAAAPASDDALRLASLIENKLGDKAAADRYAQRLRTEFPQAGSVPQLGEPSQP